MRTIETHKVNGLNDALTIQVLDEPGAGGACHEYLVSYAQPNPYAPGESVMYHCGIKFQKGPIQEAGVNGISNEVLLSVVIDRLAGFQAGPYACDENAEALAYIREGLHCLLQRTIDRTKRGVEGTSVL
jgi:hypothetical protein